MQDQRSDDIVDIEDTPDVAVWANGIRKKVTAPSDKVNEPSKRLSMTLYFRKGGRDLFVDPADKEDVASAVRRESLTDDVNHDREE